MPQTSRLVASSFFGEPDKYTVIYDINTSGRQKVLYTQEVRYSTKRFSIARWDVLGDYIMVPFLIPLYTIEQTITARVFGGFYCCLIKRDMSKNENILISLYDSVR